MKLNNFPKIDLVNSKDVDLTNYDGYVVCSKCPGHSCPCIVMDGVSHDEDVARVQLSGLIPTLMRQIMSTLPGKGIGEYTHVLILTVDARCYCYMKQLVITRDHN